MGVDGKVFIQFVVDKEGRISDVTIIKSLSQDCDKEALRLIQLMPPWKPGKQNGRAVKSKFVLPLTFKLEV
jgi:protein TonB